MDNLNDIKDLWLSADVRGLPSSGEVIKTIKKYRRTQTVKIVTVLTLALLLLLVMIWVVYDYKSHMLTTRIGEACMLLALLILLSSNIKSLARVSAQSNCSNEAFIHYLKKEQLQLIRFIKRTQVIGFIIASTGLLLYIFEYIHTNLTWLIIGYVITVAYILLVWFVLRPKAIKKKTAKLNAIIEKLETLSTQLKSN